MKILKAIVLIAVSYAIGPMIHGATAIYTLPADATFSVQGDNVYYDYRERPFEDLRTNQYGFKHSDGSLHKRFYKTPAIHKYHGAGSVIQPLYMILPPEAYENLPAEVKAVVAPGDVDIFFLVTVVQDWIEADDGNRPLAIRPHHWNDPDAPYESGDYNKTFSDRVGIFWPSPPELTANGTVNTLYAVTETTHGPGNIISSGDSDHLTGGYVYTPRETPNLDLVFWGVVEGPTPTGQRKAVTLHWVTSDASLGALNTIHQGTLIEHWVRSAETLGVHTECAARLKTLLGITDDAPMGGGGAAGTRGTVVGRARSRTPSPARGGAGSSTWAAAGIPHDDEAVALAAALATSEEDARRTAEAAKEKADPTAALEASKLSARRY